MAEIDYELEFADNPSITKFCFNIYMTIAVAASIEIGLNPGAT